MSKILLKRMYGVRFSLIVMGMSLALQGSAMGQLKYKVPDQEPEASVEKSQWDLKQPLSNKPHFNLF